MTDFPSSTAESADTVTEDVGPIDASMYLLDNKTEEVSHWLTCQKQKSGKSASM